jgi:hypothetical protein
MELRGGRVRGVILKKVISDVRFKGYVNHASRDEPQYFIASGKTDHVAIHTRYRKKRIRGRSRRATGVAPHAGRLDQTSVGAKVCENPELLTYDWVKTGVRSACTYPLVGKKRDH